MAKPLRFLSLTPEQDEALRELELSPVVNTKVRLRASIVRLNHAGWGVPKLVTHFGRNPQSVHNDLDRFEQMGIAGLSDGKAPGNKPSITPEIKVFLEAKIAEDQVWNSTLLGEAVREQFGVKPRSCTARPSSNLPRKGRLSSETTGVAGSAGTWRMPLQTQMCLSQVT